MASTADNSGISNCLAGIKLITEQADRLQAEYKADLAKWKAEYDALLADPNYKSYSNADINSGGDEFWTSCQDNNNGTNVCKEDAKRKNILRWDKYGEIDSHYCGLSGIKAQWQWRCGRQEDGKIMATEFERRKQALEQSKPQLKQATSSFICQDCRNSVDTANSSDITTQLNQYTNCVANLSKNETTATGGGKTDPSSDDGDTDPSSPPKIPSKKWVVLGIDFSNIYILVGIGICFMICCSCLPLAFFVLTKQRGPSYDY